MTKLVNFRWSQGEDLNIQLIYREGDAANKTLPIDLSANYLVRMDITKPDKSIIYSYLSSEHPASLGTGNNRKPNINIFLPRALTLPGGVVYMLTNSSNPITTFTFDIFLRNTTIDKQVKILRGTIISEASNTLWP